MKGHNLAGLRDKGKTGEEKPFTSLLETPLDMRPPRQDGPGPCNSQEVSSKCFNVFLTHRRAAHGVLVAHLAIVGSLPVGTVRY